MICPKISIIVPVYNGEKYLKKCIESIENQTFSDYEAVFVNDGSTDNSQQILDEIQEKDERFHCHIVPNGGVSKARNFGLDMANGEWITFIDCDDWVEDDYLESLYSHANDDVDIVMANFFFNREKMPPQVATCSKSIIHKSEISAYPLAMMVEDCSAWNKLRISVEILCAACNKLTRRQLITSNSIRFEEKLKLNEDGLFHLTSFLNARDIVIIDKPLYHYRITASSSNNRYRPDVHSQMLIWNECFSRIISGMPEKVKEQFMSLSAYRMYLNLVSLYLNHPMNKQSFIQKNRLLGNYLSSGIYKVETIPSSLKWFKKVEMFLLSKKYTLGLLVLSNIRIKLKK